MEMQRLQTPEPDLEVEEGDTEAERTQEHFQERRTSAKSKPDLRLAVLGGDSVDSCYACNTILRYGQTEERINPQKGNYRGKTIGEKQVLIFRTPSYWMEHLASGWIFSERLQSIRHEVEECTTTLFPGPHAFLLVMRTDHAAKKEYYLLRAITSVFGAEALEYTMVIFVHKHEQDISKKTMKSRCMRMCGERYYCLEDTDENVEGLFSAIESMTKKKESKFFVQQSYENLMKTCFESWEDVRLYKEKNLIEVLEETETEKTKFRKELDTYRQTEIRLIHELEASRQAESELQKDLEASRHKESELRKDLDASRHKESELRKDLDASRHKESELRKDLDASRQHEEQQKKKIEELNQIIYTYERETEEYKERENKQQEELKELEASDEMTLRKQLRKAKINGKQLKMELDELQNNLYESQREVKEYRERERDLQQELKALQAQEEQQGIRLEQQMRQTSEEVEPTERGLGLKETEFLSAKGEIADD